MDFISLSVQKCTFKLQSYSFFFEKGNFGGVILLLSRDIFLYVPFVARQCNVEYAKTAAVSQFSRCGCFEKNCIKRDCIRNKRQ